MITRITIDMDNEEFAGRNQSNTVARILFDLSTLLRHRDRVPQLIPLSDINGNKVGQLEVVDE